MAELLVELLSEEIPARMQARAAADFRRLTTERLEAAGLAYTQAEAWVTPRRLTLVVDGLPERQPDLVEEKKGPKVGAPAQAVEGFLRANGLASVEEAERRETPKGTFYFAVRKVAGRPTSDVVTTALPELIAEFRWPKSMRWNSTGLRWVRPLRNVMVVFDGRPLDFPLSYASGRIDPRGDIRDVVPGTNGRTCGHRFLAPTEFAVTSAADYQARLREAFVLVDPAERRQAIVEQCSRLAHDAGLAVKPDSALIDEVTGLVEWPQVLMGAIPPAFMGLPAEVLTTAMRAHQKYFALVGPDGRLADRFLLVANLPAEPGSARRHNIVAGNERVLAARLADARFFWDQDRKRSLESRVDALKDMVFHARLGSLADKVARMEALAVAIAAHVPGADPERVRRAARLAKADLTSGMVGEFPELQGVMGRYYALHDGEPAEVAQAIAEHYAPLGPSDDCPSAPLSVAVALADKLDTLYQFFAIGERPTGSKDPFALRRAALGVIRLIIENGIRLPLRPILEHAGYAWLSPDVAAVTGGRERVAANVLDFDFFAERLKVALREKGVRHDLVAAVFALGDEDDLVRLLVRVEALEAFLESEDGANLLVAYRRAANIVRIEQKKDKATYDGPVDATALVEPEERALFRALGAAAEAATAALAEEDFTAAMAALAALRQPVDVFFDKVTVNAEDAGLRANRLRLLAGIGVTLGQVADFSLIEG